MRRVIGAILGIALAAAPLSGCVPNLSSYHNDVESEKLSMRLGRIAPVGTEALEVREILGRRGIERWEEYRSGMAARTGTAPETWLARYDLVEVYSLEPRYYTFLPHIENRRRVIAGYNGEQLEGLLLKGKVGELTWYNAYTGGPIVGGGFRESRD